MVASIRTDPLTPTGDTYAVLVHRNHAHRVRQAMECGPRRPRPDTSDASTTWISLDKSNTANSPRVFNDGIGDCTDTSQTTVIPTPYEKGGRKSRRGYALLIIRNAQCSPVELPSIARQQISWASKMTHCTTATCGKERTDNDVSSAAGLVKEIAQLAFHQLKQQHFVFEESQTRRADELRLDIRPKSLVLGICSELQRIATEAGVPIREDTDPTDPYDGPLRMTRSVTKCSHVLNLVFNSLDEDEKDGQQRSPPTCAYWGISSAEQHSAIIGKLNNYASPWIEPIENATNVAAPCSRAYYKMHQVFDEHLQQYLPALNSAAGAGLDLGASPGGWTQVLHQNGLRPLVAIDQGLLAPRVRDLDGVWHVQGDFSSEESIQVIAQSAPYTAIVCDANIYLDLFDYISKTLEMVSKHLCGRQEGLSALLTLPSVCVFTVKMPYKTEESLRRNFDWAMSQITVCLQRIVASMKSSVNDKDGKNTDILVKYTVVHLHANSESERTLIAVFDEKKV